MQNILIFFSYIYILKPTLCIMSNSIIKNNFEIINKQALEILSSNTFQELLHDTPNVIMILNMQRQVIYLNRNPVDTNDGNVNKPTGQKAGECLGCINVGKGEMGCSSSEFCKVCGFNAAITASEAGETAENECNISLNNGTSLTLSVHTKPFYFNNERFIFCALENISEKMRRQMLENIFLHDILNTAAVLRGLSEAYEDMPAKKIRNMLEEVAANITDEIQSYKLISNAETQTLEINYEDVSLGTIIQEVVQSMRSIQKFSNRMIEISYDDGKILTERTLLRRILINMLKNALEASTNKDKVEILGYLDPETGHAKFSVKNPQLIPKADQLKLFQKSFSTKGRGRGWGTYSIKVLAEKYLQGSVKYSSQAGEGTVFTISIPSLES